MMAMWFGLAAIAFLGAGALLYLDSAQRRRFGRARQGWARMHGYSFTINMPSLAGKWTRAALAKQDYLNAIDVVNGVYRNQEFFLFDLEDTSTVVAVRRLVDSDVEIDLRLKSTTAPKDTDFEMIGAIGDRVMYSNFPEVALRACDQRLINLVRSIPDKVHTLWNEGAWTLGVMATGADRDEIEEALDSVARLSGLLYVLPPQLDGEVLEPARRPAPLLTNPILSTTAPTSGPMLFPEIVPNDVPVVAPGSAGVEDDESVEAGSTVH